MCWRTILFLLSCVLQSSSSLSYDCEQLPLIVSNASDVAYEIANCANVSKIADQYYVLVRSGLNISISIRNAPLRIVLEGPNAQINVTFVDWHVSPLETEAWALGPAAFKNAAVSIGGGNSTDIMVTFHRCVAHLANAQLVSLQSIGDNIAACSATLMTNVILSVSDSTISRNFTHNAPNNIGLIALPCLFDGVNVALTRSSIQYYNSVHSDLLFSIHPIINALTTFNGSRGLLIDVSASAIVHVNQMSSPPPPTKEYLLLSFDFFSIIPFGRMESAPPANSLLSNVRVVVRDSSLDAFQIDFGTYARTAVLRLFSSLTYPRLFVDGLTVSLHNVTVNHSAYDSAVWICIDNPIVDNLVIVWNKCSSALQSHGLGDPLIQLAREASLIKADKAILTNPFVAITDMTALHQASAAGNNISAFDLSTGSTCALLHVGAVTNGRLVFERCNVSLTTQYGYASAPMFLPLNLGPLHFVVPKFVIVSVANIMLLLDAKTSLPGADNLTIVFTGCQLLSYGALGIATGLLGEHLAPVIPNINSRSVYLIALGVSICYFSTTIAFTNSRLQLRNSTLLTLPFLVPDGSKVLNAFYCLSAVNFAMYHRLGEAEVPVYSGNTVVMEDVVIRSAEFEGGETSPSTASLCTRLNVPAEDCYLLQRATNVSLFSFDAIHQDSLFEANRITFDTLPSSDVAVFMLIGTVQSPIASMIGTTMGMNTSLADSPLVLRNSIVSDGVLLLLVDLLMDNGGNDLFTVLSINNSITSLPYKRKAAPIIRNSLQGTDASSFTFIRRAAWNVTATRFRGFSQLIGGNVFANDSAVDVSVGIGCGVTLNEDSIGPHDTKAVCGVAASLGCRWEAVMANCTPLRIVSRRLPLSALLSSNGAVLVSFASLSSLALPVSGFMVQRTMSLLKLMERCSSDADGPADTASPLDSPTQLRIGGDERQSVRGTAIGNTFVVLPGVALIALAVSCVAQYRRHLRTTTSHGPLRFAAMCATAGMPGLLWAPLSLFLQPTVSSGVQLAVNVEQHADIVIGGLAVIAYLGTSLALVGYTLARLRVEVIAIAPRRGVHGTTLWKRAVAYLLEPQVQWCRANGDVSYFRQLFGKVFEGYRSHRVWFALVEITASVFFGLQDSVSALAAPTEHCRTILWINLGVSIAMLLLSGSLPYSSRLCNLNFTFNSVLLVVAAACLLLDTTTATAAVALFAGYVAVFLSLVDIVIAVMNLGLRTAVLRIFFGHLAVTTGDTHKVNRNRRIVSPIVKTAVFRGAVSSSSAVTVAALENLERLVVHITKSRREERAGVAAMAL